MTSAVETATGARRTNLLSNLVPRLFGLSADQASFQTRGFSGPQPPAQLALEKVGQTFIAGYNAALVARHAEAFTHYIDTLAPEHRGFAAEGMAMGAAVADALPFRRPMLPTCLAALDSRFTYLVHVGAGWAIARVPWRRKRILSSLDTVHRWLAIDGLGFHDTYFYHHRILAGWRRERTGYAARAYDQGVGRALWFVAGGSVSSAVRLISAFPDGRQSDLWSGLGLAMAYAGPAGEAEATIALTSAGAHAANYAQGIAFACAARALAGHIPAHTVAVTQSVWTSDADDVAALVRRSRASLPTTETDPPPYQTWRESVARAFPGARRSSS